MRRVCRSKKDKKQDKQEENVLLLLVTAAAAAAVGDPHSLSDKVVTLDTSQSPMDWLNCVASRKAALGDVEFEPTTTNIMKETK